MSDQSEAIVTTLVPSDPIPRSNPLDSVRQLTYAWVGLWAVASEDLGNFFQRCVARGEQMLNAPPAATALEETALAHDAAADPKKAAPKSVRPTTIVNAFGAVESYHFDLNIDQLLPTKEELDALAERVEALSREVNALVEQHQVEQ